MVAALALQFAALLALTVGPWTNEPAELSGWDVERFQTIAEEPGRAWVDQAVEYPPGSVVLIEALAIGDVVSTHRLLAITSFLVLAATTALLYRAVGVIGAAAFVVLGTPLIPGGLVRFDLWAAGLGAAALIALWQPTSRSRIVGPAAIVIGAAIKIVPIVILPIAIGRRQWRVVATTIVFGFSAVIAWFVFVGGTAEGFDAIDQVVSLRGTTGWHVESIPGALVALVTGEEARLEQNAYRIGTVSPLVSTVGRLVFAAVTLVLIALRLRTGSNRSCDAAMAVALIATLLTTAPLLSPQFLLWLTPFAAMVAAEQGWRHPIVLVTGATTLITGLTLAIFGPPGVDAWPAALLLTARNGLLIALVPLGVRHLTRSGAHDQLVAHK